MQNPVVYFEILGKDAKYLHNFYNKVFNWKLKVEKENPYNWAEVKNTDGHGIPGGVGSTFEKREASVTFYIEVEDVQTFLDKAVDAGGKVIMPATGVPGTNVFIAKFADPEGNIIGLVKKGSH